MIGPMRHEKNNLGREGEHGTALIVTLLFLVTLGVLATGLLFTVQLEMQSSASYKYSQQAFYVANASAQKAVVWFNNSYSPHVPASDYNVTTVPVRYSGRSVLLAGQTGSSSAYPESGVMAGFSTEFSNKSLQADALNSGVYATNATLLKYTPATFINTTTFLTYTSAMERWRVDSIGYWGTVARPMGTAQISTVIENSGNAFFDRAIWGIDSVSLSGNASTDSFDPALGPYGGLNVGNRGSIGSNGSVSFNGSVSVHGDVAYGPTGTFSGGDVTGQIIHMSQPRFFPPLPSFAVGATNISLGGHSSQTIPAGSYGDISLGSHGVLTLSGGLYYVNSISIGAQAQLVISGPTTIFVKSALDLGGQGVANPTALASNLNIFYAGTNAVSMRGGSQFSAELYAPNATVTMGGNSEFFGSFIGKTISNDGTPDINFDEGSLRNNLIQRPFRVINWSQTVY
ncbi:MAG TPA: pilus assembly PilX N-terminal domain-containing protein [Acidobacteriota bacterium]|nr:pilus assembly PilX N-terminal domain-containing protein [Acidobacteriota bacterium]